MYLRSILLFAVAVGAMAAPVMHPKGAKKSSDSGKKARADMRTYFAEQEEQNMIANMEGYKASHQDQFDFSDLPCVAHPEFKLACDSVKAVKRNRGRVVPSSAKNGKKGIHSLKATDQSLFTEKYRPDDSRHYDTKATSSFEANTAKTFDLHYADGSHLRGFEGKDMVQLGDYESLAPFGVITDCNSPDFNGVDGILGFGLPREYSNMPHPILFSIHAANPGLQRKFSFFSTDDEAEVQLGGYDPDTVSGTMWYVGSNDPEDFIVGATSLQFGDTVADSIELLQFKTGAGGAPSALSSIGLPSILDSGTSCLVIPADNSGGALKNVPWDTFAKHWSHTKSFWLVVGGKKWEIPASSWYLADTEQTCVQPSPAGMQGLLVGDVFFREFVVEFDLTRADRHPILGIAPLNKAYRPVKQLQLSEFELNVAPKQKLTLTKANKVMYPASHSEELTKVDRIPIENSMGTQYFMDVHIGSPKQKFTVIFDTGSTVFGVFTWKKDLPTGIKNKLPGYYFSQNLRSDLEQVGASSRPDMFAGFGYSAYSRSFIAGLVCANLALVAGVLLVSRKLRAKGAAMREARTNYGAI